MSPRMRCVISTFSHNYKLPEKARDPLFVVFQGQVARGSKPCVKGTSYRWCLSEPTEFPSCSLALDVHPSLPLCLRSPSEMASSTPALGSQELPACCTTGAVHQGTPRGTLTIGPGRTEYYEVLPQDRSKAKTLVFLPFIPSSFSLVDLERLTIAVCSAGTRLGFKTDIRTPNFSPTNTRTRATEC
jgi:hypothetical protein